MTDHKPARPAPANKVVGVRDLKTHAARIMRHVRETRASYILTHRGVAVAMILPLDPAENTLVTSEAAAAPWDAFLGAGRRLAPRFRPRVSGVRLLSAMRR